MGKGMGRYRGGMGKEIKNKKTEANRN
jgi:hypothetical protein